MKTIFQNEVNKAVEWLSDNRLCIAPDKSKIIIPGHHKLKESLGYHNLEIEVGGHKIRESYSEKLLGVVINNKMTFKNHMHGDENNKGLLRKLSKSVGIIRKLSKSVSNDKLKIFIDSIFYSRVNYCLPVYGNVFHLEKYKLSDVRYTNYTIKDNNFLQVLQNKVNRILTNSSIRTPTIELLQRTNSLSIQQMVAYQTPVTLGKIIKSSKSHYLAKKKSLEIIHAKLYFLIEY